MEDFAQLLMQQALRVRSCQAAMISDNDIGGASLCFDLLDFLIQRLPAATKYIMSLGSLRFCVNPLINH
jgi:hypothetical protein